VYIGAHKILMFYHCCASCLPRTVKWYPCTASRLPS